MRANFTHCAQLFAANTTDAEALRAKWGWTGPLVGIPPNHLTQISREGCLAVCGHGVDYYKWEAVSGTITTWLLPVVGTLLQAPFESNATKRTFLAIARWVGSPIASLAYVLWNIKVSAKAALMVDMSVKYDDLPGQESNFGSMRDSMYLLLVMNQYTLKPTAILKEAEGLLRIALFSRDLKLTDTNKSLREMREILAREVREMRRRGAVPVFVSILWFLFAFALSIQAAFGDLGQNTTAHDLALGCLLAWFPILIMGSIVDRNPIATEAIRKKLYGLVDHVRHALNDEENRSEFLHTFHDQPDAKMLTDWVMGVTERSQYMKEFFLDFAGQARVRWHYGAAHPILSDIENCYIAEKGRNWLANEGEARAKLVLGPVNDEGLVWFDPREFWQVASAIVIVGGSCGGAFTLSFFTPTVGLGCRSGGYTIFFSIALGLLIVEMTVWLILSPVQVDSKWLARTTTRLQSNAAFHHFEHNAHTRWGLLKRTASNLINKTEGHFVRSMVKLTKVLPWKDKEAMGDHVESEIETMFDNLRNMNPKRKWEVFFFRPVEVVNAFWLVYIVLAQTTGYYKTCDCVTSTWGGGGGYLDFSVQDTSNSKWVEYYWLTGTILTSVIMALSMFYITVEWCQQSFLSTERYEDAISGLRKTRIYRRHTFFFRQVSRVVIRWTLSPLEKVSVVAGLLKTPQQTLLWTRGFTHDPDVPRPANFTATYRYNPPSPAFEFQDFSTTTPRAGTYMNEAPPAAHSLFVPPNPSIRPRLDSDASRAPSNISDDSSFPLMQVPSGAYQGAGERKGRSSDEDRTSSELSSSASPPPGQSAVVRGWSSADAGMSSRQGYRRANSDAASHLRSGAEGGGLGIRMEGREDERV